MAKKMKDELVLTKFIIPPSRPKLVLRDRLKSILDDSIQAQHRLILVSAKAGSGKTTLISEWLHSIKLHTSWLSLDEHDNSPSTFFSHFIEALARLGVELNKDIYRQLSFSPLPDQVSLITYLSNAITLYDQPFVLVLDDLHIISNDWILRTLEGLVDNLPPSATLVIISRTVPPLALSRLRACGQLTEIRSQDLRFTSSEVKRFFRKTMGMELHPATIEKIEKRTEGWIAGLQLAAISIKGFSPGTESSDFFQEFNQTNRFILDYLAEEVLRQQPAAVHDFLLDTSILKAMNGSLCDAVHPDSPSPEASIQFQSNQAILEYLNSANLFVVPLDEKHQWYRYHHLFADFLKITLTEAKPADYIKTLHERAAKWHGEHGSINKAMYHSISAGDYESAAIMINENFAALFSRNEVPVLLSWIDKFPLSTLQKYPWIVLYQAYTFALGGKADSAEGLLTRLKSGSSFNRIGEDSPANHLTAIQAYLANLQQDGERAVSLATEALNTLNHSHALATGMAAFARADTHIANDELLTAEQDLNILLQTGEESGHLLLRVQARCVLASVRLSQGQLIDAESLLDQAQMVLSDHSAFPTRESCAYDFAMAELLRERNQLEDAHFLVQEGMNLREKLGGYLVVGDLILMQILQSMGDVSGALEVLAQTEKYFKMYQFQLSLGVKFRAAKLTQWLLTGDLKQAQRAADQCGDSELEIIARAKLALVSGQIEDAIALLLPQLKSARKESRGGREIELLVVLAACFQAQNKIPDAIQTLKNAIGLAKPESYMRPFIEIGKPVHELLKQIIPGEVPSSSSKSNHSGHEAFIFEFKIMNALEEYASSASFGRFQPYPHTASEIQLTDRELEVLTLLSEGITNKEIASRLVVSPSTIKQHLKNIYKKLSVNSRTQAVLKAKDLGFL